ncbi:MAG: hypothetical protein ACE5HY_01740 [Candidatus Hydrothermarchaeales archaeon]
MIGFIAISSLQILLKYSKIELVGKEYFHIPILDTHPIPNYIENFGEGFIN